MPDQTKETAQWTVMIYFAGFNNLNEECVYALKEIRRAGMNIGKQDESKAEKESHPNWLVNVVAQFDSGDAAIPTFRYKLRGGGTTADELDNTLRYFVTKELDTDEISYRKLLRDFIFTSMEENPAEHYMLVLSGHGSGTVDDFLSRGPGPWGNVSIPDLQMILDDVNQKLKKEGRANSKCTIDLLGMDSCLMSMAEIGYELREYVDYMVAAEGFESNTGWPYERIISLLLQRPNIAPAELTTRIVEQYTAYYRDYQIAALSVDLSACDLRKCNELADAIRNLAEVLSKGLLQKDPNEAESAITKAIILAHWKAQSYKFDQYTDLYDFCDLLAQETKNKDVLDACSKVKGVLGTGEAEFTASQIESGEAPMILRSCFSGSDVQHSHGLSVYFPWSRVAETYQVLKFNQATGWYDFLRTYVEQTRRQPRECKDANGSEKSKPAFGSVSPTLMGEANKYLVDGSKYLVDGSKYLVDGSKDLLLNGNSSMKNPPSEYFDCSCGTATVEALASTIAKSNNRQPKASVKSRGHAKRKVK